MGKKPDEFTFFHEEWMRVHWPAPRETVDSLFEELIHRTWGRAEWTPSVDVFETAAAFLVEIDLPGVDPERLQVTAGPGRVTISGERPPSKREELVCLHLAERPHGRFLRTLEFRTRIDPPGLRQHFQDGVLRLTIPKARSGGTP